MTRHEMTQDRPCRPVGDRCVGDKPGLYRPTVALLRDPDDPDDPNSGGGSSHPFTIVVE